MACPSRRWHKLLAAVSLAPLVVATGCERGPQMAPVSGRVLYNGRPLPFGSVTFQPPSGQPARGEIESDGTFSLSTHRPGDGAVVGQHQVRIACYESQRASAEKGKGEQSLGRSLIPEDYTYFDRSGLTADVRADTNEPFVFELTGPPEAALER